ADGGVGGGGDAVLARGFIEEVVARRARGCTAADPAGNATGYIEVLRYLGGVLDLDAAREEIKRATRRYARRQLTWLRHQLPAGAVRLDATLPAATLAERITARWQ